MFKTKLFDNIAAIELDRGCIGLVMQDFGGDMSECLGLTGLVGGIEYLD